MGEIPDERRYFERLASFSRLIMFDKRGTGLSDRVAVATLEERMDDLRAVMDAAGSQRAAVYGGSEGGALALLFAATYPERVSALVLYGAYPRISWAPDYPDGMPEEIWAEGLRYLEENWGRGQEADLCSTSRTGPGRRSDLAQSTRAVGAPLGEPGSGSCDHADEPRDRRAPPLVRDPGTDSRCAIARQTFRTPRAAATWVRTSQAPKSSNLQGNDYFPHLGDQDAILDEIEEFLTGVRPVHVPDRALATVLFTDIVSSTERAAALGDDAWTRTLDHHDALVAREVERHRGRKINPTGDGILATFDGPARAVRCAQAICEEVRSLGIEVRAGLHTGEIELRGEDIGGIAVHIGQRVSALAGPGEVLVSSTVKDLVAGSGITFADRGSHVLKGVPGRMAGIRGELTREYYATVTRN